MGNCPCCSKLSSVNIQEQQGTKCLPPSPAWHREAMAAPVGHSVRGKMGAKGPLQSAKLRCFKRAEGSSNFSPNSQRFQLNRNKMSDLNKGNSL